MTTKSSAYSSFQGKSTRNCLEIASMTSANSKRFRPEHYCISTATSNRHYYHRLSQPQFLHHIHGHNHNSRYQPFVNSAWLPLVPLPYLTRRNFTAEVASMHIHRYPVKCIFYIHKTKWTFLSFALYFSCNCLITKVAFLNPHWHINKLAINYLYLLPNSVLKSSFYHRYSAL